MEIGLAIVLFVAILAIATLICGVWVFCKFMGVLGQLVGGVLRMLVAVVNWVSGAPSHARLPPGRVVTADGVFQLPARSGAATARPRSAPMPQAPPRAPAPLSNGMIRCTVARCLAVNPDEARYCHRCGHLLAAQAAAAAAGRVPARTVAATPA